MTEAEKLQAAAQAAQQEVSNTPQNETAINPTVSPEDIATAIKTVDAEVVRANSNTTTVQLPSNGLMNPSIKEVTLKRMSVKQSKTLFTSKDPNYLTTLVMDCIVEPVNIRREDLHPNDIVYLLFILRRISSPKNVVQKVYCNNPRCRHEFTTPVNVDQLKVNYATPSEYKFSVKLPDAQDTIQFRILSEGQLINCDKIAERQIKQYEIKDEEEADWHRLISKTAYMFVSKNDLEFDQFKDKIDYIETLSAFDFATFNKAYNDIVNSFGLDRKFIVTCPKCGEVQEVEAYVAPDFFLLV